MKKTAILMAVITVFAVILCACGNAEETTATTNVVTTEATTEATTQATTTEATTTTVETTTSATTVGETPSDIPEAKHFGYELDSDVEIEDIPTFLKELFPKDYEIGKVEGGYYARFDYRADPAGDLGDIEMRAMPDVEAAKTTFEKAVGPKEPTSSWSWARSVVRVGKYIVTEGALGNRELMVVLEHFVVDSSQFDYLFE